MENIISIIKSKNPEDVTQKELNAFRLLIEEAFRRVTQLQLMHRELTGKDYVPPIRLQSDTADGEGEAVLEGVAYLVNNIDCDTISLIRR